MRFERAILRRPGPDFGDGLTTAGLGAPDYALMLEQHAAYREALESLGLRCTVLDPLPGCPDAHFVEDTAVLAPDVAIVTRPGAESRRGETASIEHALAGMKPIARIDPPGTVDGGDILLAGDRCYIGLSRRTNEAGATQLAAHLEQAGIDSAIVRVPSGLHLKSGANYLGSGRMLVTQEFAAEPAFARFERIVLEPADGYAANTLWINGTLLTPAGFPRVRSRLERLGYPVIVLDASESARMDGGLSCLSLRF